MKEMCAKLCTASYYRCNRPLPFVSTGTCSSLITCDTLWSHSSSSSWSGATPGDNSVGQLCGRLESQLVVPLTQHSWFSRGYVPEAWRRADGATSTFVTDLPVHSTRGFAKGGAKGIDQSMIAELQCFTVFATRRKTRAGHWGLTALDNLGGACIEHKSFLRTCIRRFVTSTSRASGGLVGKGPSTKSRRMELFKPQLMDTIPFRFLSEYHSTPPRAGKDAISPIFFFGFGQSEAPVLEVVQAGDPVLHEPAAEVGEDEIGSARIERIINDMVATMRNAPGVGLAASQIGIPLQIIVLEDTKELMSYSSPEECEAQQRVPFDLLVIINPKLKTKTGSGSAVFFEGCLSVDGYRALVERDLDVEVTGLGRDGRPIHVEASGWKARILQHECDHLAGNLYVDKMIPRTFRTKNNLRLPLPTGCPNLGICKHST